ncbi:MAG: hypothetical protein R2849_06615 [Thermomicrobiales bacterium]
MRWLRGVITGDLDGYAVISGGGRTIIVLYGEEIPISAAVTRGPDVANMTEALEALRTEGPSDFFAMTYHLPEGAPAALSGLFASPSSVVTLTDPRPQLKALLAEQLNTGYTGSVLVRHQDTLWAILLLVDGDIIGCYGSDDTGLKGTIDDAMALLHLDELDVALYPGFTDERLEDVISFDSTSYLGDSANESIEETEMAMISLLSELEAEISGVTADDEPSRLVYSLIESYKNALELVHDGPEIIASEPPAHPLLDSHWLPEQRMVDTDSLARTLEMAAIPDAWLAASDALILALESTVEQQLTWLSMSDKLSATALKEALAELLGEARGRVRGWRQARRSAESDTNRPLARKHEGLTIF